MRLINIIIRKGMNLIIFGAVLLLCTAINVSADNTEDSILEIRTTTMDETENLIIVPNPEKRIDYDTAIGDRGDIEMDTDPKEEPLIIAPNSETEDVLIYPKNNANGEIFILDNGNQANLETAKETSTLISFPIFTIIVSIGLLGCIYLCGKKQEKI